MKRPITSLILMAAILMSGCSLGLRTKDGTTVSGTVHGSSEQHLSREEQSCAPNQYWDGQCCRHKGRGQGARKHDSPSCR